MRWWPWLMVCGGCKAVEPAPPDLDSLLHEAWAAFDGASDAEAAEVAALLHDVVDGDALEGPVDGSVSRLNAGEAALVGVTSRDPALAAGIYLANVIWCDLDQLSEILVHPQQDELYGGVYDSYSRTYDGDTSAWAAGTSDRVGWDLAYEASVLGASYTANARGDLRRVPKVDSETSPHGAVVYARAFMPAPAVFDTDNKTMDQDYQLELYWQRAPGELVHVYGMWRQADWGAGFTSEDASVQRILLNNLADWDETTSELCAEGTF
jgi:hypothetical protein